MSKRTIYQVGLNNESELERNKAKIQRIHPEVEETFLPAERNIFTRLHESIINNDYERIEEFLSLGDDPETRLDKEEDLSPSAGLWPCKDDTILHFALKIGNYDLAKIFAERYPKLLDAENCMKQTSLHITAAIGNHSLIFLLRTDNNLDRPDYWGNTPLHLATQNKYKNAVEILINLGANKEVTNNWGYTPLHLAAKEDGEGKIVDLLLDRGANRYATDKVKNTPLHLAAGSDRVEAIKILISKHGATKEIKNDRGDTPLHLAALGGHVGAINKLIKYHANLEAVNNGGNTPLHLAVTHGKAVAVVNLLAHYANSEAKNINNYTPLHLAALYGCYEVAEALIKQGASKEAKQSCNLTPLAIAMRKDEIDIMKLLIVEGAELPWLIECSIEAIKIHQIAQDIRNICLFEELVSRNILGDYNEENISFAVEVFSKHFTREIAFNTYSSLKSTILVSYSKIFPSELLKALVAEIDRQEFSVMELMGIIEGQIFSYLEGISPILITIFTSRSLPGASLSESGQLERKKYIEFLDKPNNQKYKVVGTKLIEMMKSESSLGVDQLVDLMIRGNMTEFDSINILQEIKISVWILSNSILPAKIRRLIDKSLELYERYGDDSVMHSRIRQEDTILLKSKEHDSILEALKFTKSELEITTEQLNSLQSEITQNTEAVKVLTSKLDIMAQKIDEFAQQLDSGTVEFTDMPADTDITGDCSNVCA